MSPGGSFSTPPAFPALIDTRTHFQPSCQGSNGVQLAGSFKSGTGLRGAGLGTITSATGLCNPATTVAWPLNAMFYNAAKSTFTGTISKMHLAVSGAGCSFVVDGTGSSADNGTAAIKWYNHLGRELHFLPSGTLHAYDVSGCNGLVKNHDVIVIIGYFQVTPTQTITSP